MFRHVLVGGASAGVVGVYCLFCLPLRAMEGTEWWKSAGSLSNIPISDNDDRNPFLEGEDGGPQSGE